MLRRTLSNRKLTDFNENEKGKFLLKETSRIPARRRNGKEDLVLHQTVLASTISPLLLRIKSESQYLIR